MITLAALAALADTLARRVASDVPSAFCLQYSGTASGPSLPYAFTVDALFAECSNMRLHDAAFLTARTRLLDYFRSTRDLLLRLPVETAAPSTSGPEEIDSLRLCFRYDSTMSWGGGDACLIDQLCCRLGYPANGYPETEDKVCEDAAAVRKAAPWRYFTGEAAEFGADWPELFALRDVVLLFKACLAPDANDLPPLGRWRVTDSAPTWTADKDGTLQVRAFGRSLRCAYSSRSTSGGNSGGRGFFSRVLGFFGTEGAVPRAPLSAADPSALARSPIESEDDVLHLKDLPDFGGRISSNEAEYLLQVCHSARYSPNFDQELFASDGFPRYASRYSLLHICDCHSFSNSSALNIESLLWVKFVCKKCSMLRFSSQGAGSRRHRHQRPLPRLEALTPLRPVEKQSGFRHG